VLHKKRTGSAFRITKEIVKKEARYEEVDELYQEKRLRMLQAQNLQIKEEFHHHSQTNFAAYANSQSNGPSFASQRASNMTPDALIDGGSCAMGLDVSYIRSSFLQGPGALASPKVTVDDYFLSPTTLFEPSAQSHVACMSGSNTLCSNVITPSTNTAAHIPDCATHQTPNPVWSTGAMQQQQISTPSQTPTNAYAVQIWQQQMIQQAQMHANNAIRWRQCMDRVASAPEFALQHPTPPQHAPAGSISGPTGQFPSHAHSRSQFQPNNYYDNLHSLDMVSPTSSASSPKIKALSAGTQSNPDFCPNPNTPLSLTPDSAAQATMVPTIELENDGIMGLHKGLSPNINEFGEFSLGNSSHPLPDWEQPFGFDD
jgi:hypothetical protein